MKLYFAPRTRAVRARWLLEELGVPYELIKLEPARQEHIALVDGEATLRESLAICLHLADRFPEQHLAPRVGSPERGPYYQWMAFAEVSLEPVVMAFHRHALLPEGQRAPAHSEEELAKHRVSLGAMLGVITAGLRGREVLVGGMFSAADVVMASILHLANTLGLLDGWPGLVEYVQRHTQRPAVRRAVSG
jgi:glutathione S-transferase